MDLLLQCLQFILHLNVHLAEFNAHYGAWTYGLLFLIIFCETGFVFTPFLPGDSLLFATGTLAAQQAFDLNLLLILLIPAAILGDSLNYAIGSFLAPRVFAKEKSLLFNRQYIHYTHAYFEKYGGKTIIIARFIPLIRTYAPFVAGIGGMPYKRFLKYNVIGGILWIGGLLTISYWFGNIPVVKNNFGIVIISIIILSIMPAAIEFLKRFYKK